MQCLYTDMSSKIKAVAIVGPTASGKTGLSLRLAERFCGEIVSADSMQIYRGMDIGTAKANPNELLRVPHHMVDICDIGTIFSVADYSAMAKKCIVDIHERGKLPFIVGGTGLYVDNVIKNTKFAEHNDNTTVRETLTDKLNEFGAEWLYEELKKVDPQSSEKLHVNDTKRVMRALECYILTGKTKTELDAVSRNDDDFCESLYIGICFDDRQKLYQRINERVDQLMRDGLVSEVESLLNKGLADCSTAYQAIGYKEIAQYILGKCSLDEAVEQLKMATRRYAKRQMTWFNRNEKINWLVFDKDFDCDKDKLYKKAEILVEEFVSGGKHE